MYCKGMPNPFKVKYEFLCHCMMLVMPGDCAFHHDRRLHCTRCAASKKLICQCGKYKKPGMGMCYDCTAESKDYNRDDFS